MLAKVNLRAWYFYLFFSLTSPFLSCWAHIPRSLSLPGILEILGEEGSRWGVLEAGGREKGGHLQGQRSSLLHSAGAARLSPCEGGGGGKWGRVLASAWEAPNRQPQALEFLPPEDCSPYPCPPPGAIVHGLYYISGLGPSAGPFGRRGF